MPGGSKELHVQQEDALYQVRLVIFLAQYCLCERSSKFYLDFVDLVRACGGGEGVGGGRTLLSWDTPLKGKEICAFCINTGKGSWGTVRPNQ